MNDEIKATYQMLNDLWSKIATSMSVSADLLEPLGKAAQNMRDAALISNQPGLKQVRCVSQQGVIHAAENRDGKPRCGRELVISESSDVYASRVPTCPRCVEIIVDEAQAKV